MGDVEAFGGVVAAPAVREHAAVAARPDPLLPAADVGPGGEHAVEDGLALFGRPDDAALGLLQARVGHGRATLAVVHAVPALLPDDLALFLRHFGDGLAEHLAGEELVLVEDVGRRTRQLEGARVARTAVHDTGLGC